MNKHLPTIALVPCLICLAGCPNEPSQIAEEKISSEQTTTQPIEATSLLGDPLYRPALSPDRQAELEANLATAVQEAQTNPDDEMAAIWRGRRLAYLGRYGDAIEIYTEAITEHPESFKLLRHRGHRYISTRQLDLAIADFSQAAEYSRPFEDEIEPDGAPNEQGIPRSTTKSNIFYHLGLAHYLKGDFEAALAAYEECMPVSIVNDDMRCATTYWLYLTLLRLNRLDDANQVLEPIVAEMDVIENYAYHRLLRLFKGELDPVEVLEGVDANSIAGPTSAYGIAIWHRSQGRNDEADAALQSIVDSGTWAAFGFIAAEADLANR